MEDADLPEPKRFVEGDRPRIPGIADHRNHLTPGPPLALLDQGGKQQLPGAGPAPVLRDIDRIFDCMPVGGPGAIAARIRKPENFAVEVSDEVWHSEGQYALAALRHFFEIRRLFLEGGQSIENLMDVNSPYFFQVGVVGGSNDRGLHENCSISISRPHVFISLRINEDLAFNADHKYNFGMRDLRLDQLQTFLDVIELGTFTAAADRIGISQPAVSLQVGQLEKKLGVRLVERVGKTVRPTEAGLSLIDHARRIGGDVEAALADMAGFGADQAGHVRLGTGATACIHLLPPVFRQLKEGFPSLQITVKTGNTRDILREVEENTLDIALVTLPVTGRMFSVTPVLEDEFVFVASADMIVPETEISPDELAHVPLILYEAGGNTRTLVDRWLTKAGVSISPLMNLGSVEAIKGLVGAGLGCAILPKSGVGGNPGQSGLSIRSLSPTLKRELAVVLRNDKPRHKGLREMEAALNAIKILDQVAPAR